jgi:hypothetical protein
MDMMWDVGGDMLLRHARPLRLPGPATEATEARSKARGFAVLRTWRTRRDQPARQVGQARRAGCS